ncbi:MAG: hypothetical protein AAF355_06695 [Myxococcota bacterium]
MPKAYAEWKVLPHLGLQQVSDNLWRLQGSLERMGLKRVMTVARRDDGGLVLHSPIAVDDTTRLQIEELGPPAYFVVPNGFHRLDSPAYKCRYPEAKIVCPSGSQKKVEEVLPVDLTYAEFPHDRSTVLREVEGIGEVEGVMIVRSHDGVTLVFNDLIFNAPHGKGLAGFVFRYVTDSTGGPKISRLARWLLMKDRSALKRDLMALAATEDLKRIVVSHHRMISEDAAATLRGVASRL